jgi:hypothetical protein
MPDPEHRLDIFDAVPGDDGDAVAGLELQRPAQRPGEPRRPHGERAIVEHGASAERDSRKAAMAPAGTLQSERDIHGRG